MAQVLPAQIQTDGPSYYSRSSLRRQSASQSSLIIGSSYASPRSRYGQAKPDSGPSSLPSSAPSSPRSYHIDTSYTSSFASSETSSFSMDSDNDTDDEVELPAYGCCGGEERNPALGLSPLDCETPGSVNDESTPTLAHPRPLEPASRPEDDIALRREPSRHVDYLSHDWKEEDIWVSWRHINANRRYYGSQSRLENALWRTWAKRKFDLHTITPDRLDWMKDCDVTWLYGPLQTAISRPATENVPPQSGTLSKSNSFVNKKPILKKRSLSEIMLQKSISTSSLVKQAAAALEAQRATDYSTRRRERSSVSQPYSDFETPAGSSRFTSRTTTGSCLTTSPSSSLESPTTEKRHIRWDNKVEQCIAVDVKEGYDDDGPDPWTGQEESDDEDEGIVMMKASKRKSTLSRSSSRGSFCSDSKTIAMLPATTLKDRPERPNPGHTISTGSGPWGSRLLSPSPSQETLRPSRPSQKFILDDDDVDEDVDWDPSKYMISQPEGPMFQEPEDDGSPDHEGMRRTASGMLMPYDPNDDSLAPSGILGRVVDSVNTARDIAHVIWNVGWKRT